jgi:ABC-type multidrug transport system ATPase subunit
MRQKLKPIIKIQDLSKKYNKKIVVNNINLEIPESCFALLGPNGAGKTTTFLMLVGLVKPSKGTAYVLGKEISQNLADTLNKIGFLPENIGFYSSFTGREFLELIISLRGNTKERKELTEKVLNWSGLQNEYWDKKIRTYSRGMRQRLGFAQAFAGNPKLIFLDEPLSNIDPLGREDLIKKIREKRKEGVTIIISSHIVSEIEQVADYVAIIDNGKIKISGPILRLAQSLGFKEFEINRIFHKEDISLNEVYETLSSDKDLYLDKPKLLSEKIIFKTDDPEKVKEFLINYQDFNLVPLSGTLSKFYRKTVEENIFEK